MDYEVVETKVKHGIVKMDNTCMDFVKFGTGKKNLIILHGLGDGLKTVRGMALPFSVVYREFIKDYTVYIFSRKRVLPKVYSSEDMARDLYRAMKILKIRKADILGVSQGGTIAQYMGIHYPQVVNKLVLVVTFARNNATIDKVIGRWIELAKKKDYHGIFVDTAENSYSEKYLRKFRLLYPIMKLKRQPKFHERFLTMAEACLRHNAYDELYKINKPTLVIGGKPDKIVSGEASLEIAERIKDCELYMYEDVGHGIYEAARDFNVRVLEFLKE